VSDEAISPLGSDAETFEAQWLTDPAYRAERRRRAPYEHIARLVIVHRMKTGLTQKALAAQVGTSESASADSSAAIIPRTLRRCDGSPMCLEKTSSSILRMVIANQR